MDTLHYLPTELALPSSASSEDMDWVAFSWNLIGSRKYHTGWPVVQVVLAPGVMLTRMRTSGDGTNPFVFGSPVGSCERQSAGEDDADMTVQAVNYTSRLMDQGYGWEQTPFSCDFTDESIQACVRGNASIRIPDQPVNTLGDALMHGDEVVLSVILSYVSTSRKLLGR